MSKQENILRNISEKNSSTLRGSPNKKNKLLKKNGDLMQNKKFMIGDDSVAHLNSSTNLGVSSPKMGSGLESN